ncbi:hypothetical protein ACFU96_10980 [Streptomyces sp. NPDC057620]|uniref:hypothetical protein n=1 Tax=Streptomyces sp. NPDC057620 TaxID=3346185 RepID=UPI00367C7EDB
MTGPETESSGTDPFGTGPSDTDPSGTGPSGSEPFGTEPETEPRAESGSDGGPDARPEYDPAAPAPLYVPRTPTGDAEVDALLDRLADADHLDTDGHVEVYEDVHRGLRDALTALDARPGPPAPQAPNGNSTYSAGNSYSNSNRS